jgi:drug/metabolite transporter (DMT)-like permease
MPNSTAERDNRNLGLLLLVGLTLGWGLNWPFMKLALSEIPPWQFRAVSTGLAGIAMLVMARVMRLPMAIPRKHWPILLVAAVFNITSWHLLIAIGVTLLQSGHAAILGFTMPVWAALLGVIFLGERFGARTGLALIFGVGAVLTLVSKDFARFGDHPLGTIIVLVAAFNWAVGTIVQKRVAWTVTSIPLAGWQLVIGVIPIAIGAFYVEDAFVWHKASLTALGSAFYLTAIAIVFCYYAWFKIVTIFPASVASIGTLMCPVLAVLSSAVLLGESLGWRELVALALVVSAMALVLVKPDVRRASSAAPPPETPTGPDGGGTAPRRAA